MTRIELKKIADPIGESLATEQNQITLEATIAEAAKSNKIDAADYSLFKGDILSAKNIYFVLSNQKLPSEFAAEIAAKKVKPAPAAT